MVCRPRMPGKLSSQTAELTAERESAEGNPEFQQSRVKQSDICSTGQCRQEWPAMALKPQARSACKACEF